MTTSCTSRLGPLSTPDFDDSRLTIISLDRQAMIDEFDLDQDGEISEHEFIAFVPFPRKHPRADQILGSWPTTFNPVPPHATVFYPLHIGSPLSLHVHESHAMQHHYIPVHTESRNKRERIRCSEDRLTRYENENENKEQ